MEAELPLLSLESGRFCRYSFSVGFGKGGGGGGGGGVSCCSLSFFVCFVVAYCVHWEIVFI